MHGSDRVPDLKLIASEPWLVEQKQQLHRGEMALFSECMRQCARKVLNTSDIVRDAMLQQLTSRPPR